jgi:hypothetical protein
MLTPFKTCTAFFFNNYIIVFPNNMSPTKFLGMLIYVRFFYVSNIVIETKNSQSNMKSLISFGPEYETSITLKKRTPLLCNIFQHLYPFTSIHNNYIIVFPKNMSPNLCLGILIYVWFLYVPYIFIKKFTVLCELNFHLCVVHACSTHTWAQCCTYMCMHTRTFVHIPTKNADQCMLQYVHIAHNVFNAHTAQV